MIAWTSWRGGRGGDTSDIVTVKSTQERFRRLVHQIGNNRPHLALTERLRAADTRLAALEEPSNSPFCPARPVTVVTELVGSERLSYRAWDAFVEQHAHTDASSA